MPKKRSPKPQRPGTKAAQKEVQVQSKVQGGRRPLFPGVPSTAHAAGILNHRSVGLFPQSTSSGKRSATRSPPSPGGSLGKHPRARTTQTGVCGSTPGRGSRSYLQRCGGRWKPGPGRPEEQQAQPWEMPSEGQGRACAAAARLLPTRRPARAGGGPREGGASAGGAGPAQGRGQQCGLRCPRWRSERAVRRVGGGAGSGWSRLAGVRAARGSPARPLEVLEPGRSAQQEPGGGEKWLPLGSAHRQGRV